MTSGMGEDNDSRSLRTLGSAIDWAYRKVIEGIPGVPDARSLADDYLRTSDPEIAIDTLINWQVVQAGAAGFVTGLGGALTLPIAIPANLGIVLFLQLRMVAAIAHIRGYDVNSDRVRALAAACLLGNAGVEAFREAGIAVGSKLTLRAIQQIPGTVIIKLNQIVGFRLLTKAGTTGIINLPRIVPIVGGLVSGGVDAVTTHAIAEAARRFFPLDLPVEPEPAIVDQ